MTHDEIRKRHFERLKNYGHSIEYAEYTGAPSAGLPSLIGDRWEIDRQIYDEFLGVLPPLAHRGDSFYLSEFAFGDITTKYTQEGDQYFCEFARYPERKASRPVTTPWGHPDTVREIAPGIIHYTTASHGGYYLSPERVAQMPEALRAFQPYAGANWYEEDCDWSIVALGFPRFFPEDAQPAALMTLKHYKPELFAAMVALIESEGKHCYTIHYADREMAREQGDPMLGVIVAETKDEAERLAAKDGTVLRRAVPCASLWAVEIKGQQREIDR